MSALHSSKELVEFLGGRISISEINTYKSLLRYFKTPQRSTLRICAPVLCQYIIVKHQLSGEGPVHKGRECFRVEIGSDGVPGHSSFLWFFLYCFCPDWIGKSGLLDCLTDDETYVWWGLSCTDILGNMSTQTKLYLLSKDFTWTHWGSADRGALRHKNLPKHKGQSKPPRYVLGRTSLVLPGRRALDRIGCCF